MKPALFPRNPHLLPRPLHAEALLRIQGRNHKLRVSPLRALLLLLTAPFRSSHPAVFLLSLCIAWVVCWAGIRLINF